MKILVPVVALVGIVGCGGDSSTQSRSDEKPPSTRPTENECETKGIGGNRTGTGQCTDAQGIRRIVVDRQGTLKMDDAQIRLSKTYKAKSVASEAASRVRAKGRFVIFHFRVKNRTHRPLQWAGGIGAVALKLGEDVFAPDDTTAAYSQALGVKGDPGTTASEIQPGQTADGWVAFDVPTSKVSILKHQGTELRVVSAEDAVNGYNAAAGTAKVQGTIRLWR